MRLRDVGAGVVVEPGEHRRGLLGAQVGEHEGDRLRQLAVEQGDDLPGLGVVEELERLAGHGRGEAVHHAGGPLGAERRLEQPEGDVLAAARRHAAAHGEVVELGERLLGDGGVDAAQPDDLGGDLLGLDLGELLHHLRRAVCSICMRMSATFWAPVSGRLEVAHTLARSSIEAAQELGGLLRVALGQGAISARRRSASHLAGPTDRAAGSSCSGHRSALPVERDRERCGASSAIVSASPRSTCSAAPPTAAAEEREDDEREREDRRRR